jgi:superoxide reductase
MTKQKEVYKCKICGNIVEMLHEGAGVMICCGQPMTFMKPLKQDPEKGEKHVPIIEKIGEDKIKVKVGDVEHPMEREHYIEWIEVICGLGTFRYDLSPEDKPVAEFYIGEIKDFEVRAYCNLHGLWSSK